MLYYIHPDKDYRQFIRNGSIDRQAWQGLTYPVPKSVSGFHPCFFARITAPPWSKDGNNGLAFRRISGDAGKSVKALPA